MNYWSKKWQPVLMGGVALGVAGFTLSHYFYSKEPHKGFAYLGIWFLLGATFFFWAAFQRKYPELSIEDDAIYVRGSRFDRSLVSHARVENIMFPHGYGKYLIMQFHHMPNLPIQWKIYKAF